MRAIWIGWNLGCLSLPSAMARLFISMKLSSCSIDEIARELVAAIEDLVGLGRDMGASAGVDLNDPDLVDVVIGEIVDGRIM